MNSLDFCNAVAQVAHPLVQKQLLEFLYHGFLVPVMGPALLQVYIYIYIYVVHLHFNLDELHHSADGL